METKRNEIESRNEWRTGGFNSYSISLVTYDGNPPIVITNKAVSIIYIYTYISML